MVPPGSVVTVPANTYVILSPEALGGGGSLSTGKGSSLDDVLHSVSLTSSSGKPNFFNHQLELDIML